MKLTPAAQLQPAQQFLNRPSSANTVGRQVADFVPPGARVLNSKTVEFGDLKMTTDALDIDGDQIADYVRSTFTGADGVPLPAVSYARISQDGTLSTILGDDNGDGRIDLSVSIEVDSDGAKSATAWADANHDGRTDRTSRSLAQGVQWFEDVDFDGVYDTETTYTMPTEGNEGSTTSRNVSIPVEALE